MLKEFRTLLGYNRSWSSLCFLTFPRGSVQKSGWSNRKMQILGLPRIETLSVHAKKSICRRFSPSKQRHFVNKTNRENNSKRNEIGKERENLRKSRSKFTVTLHTQEKQKKITAKRSKVISRETRKNSWKLLVQYDQNTMFNRNKWRDWKRDPEN